MQVANPLRVTPQTHTPSVSPTRTYFRNGKRFYELRGRALISVTSALSLIKDDSWLTFAKRNHERRNGRNTWDQYVNNAALLGTYAHYWFGCDLAQAANLPLPEFEPERPCPRVEDFEVIQSYWDDFKLIFRPRVYQTGLEQFVWHSSGYAGRVDSVLVFDNESIQSAIPLNREHIQVQNGAYSLQDGDVWLVDFKTSKAIYDSYPAQVWAYTQAYNERTLGRPVNRMAVLRINADGWEFKEIVMNAGVGMWERAMNAAREGGYV